MRERERVKSEHLCMMEVVIIDTTLGKLYV